jgi:hypothetical protein
LSAAISAKHKIVPRQVNVGELPEALRKDGVSFDPTDREQQNL